MRRVLKRFVPKFAFVWRSRFGSFRFYMKAVLRDAYRFYIFSGAFHTSHEEEALASIITIDYHRLEKGLALSDPRPGFGVTASTDLQNNLAKFIHCYGVRKICYTAIDVLRQYYEFNTEYAIPSNSLYKQYGGLKKLVDEASCAAPESIAGTVSTTRSEIMDAVNVDYESFFNHRYSVRDFSNEEVDKQLIDRAIDIAQKAPSVCNRQPWRLYCIDSKDKIIEILTMHGGARGFEDGPKKLLIVSVDIRNFHYAGERNEYWIDGGIYTMSLINALHSVGLASCCLNWCVDLRRDKALRNMLDIPFCESVIVVIAVGHYPEHFKVAASPRKDISDVVRHF